MKTIKKILFISYDGMTDPLGQSQVIPYLAGLTKYDYHFTILSCEKPGRYSAHKNYVDMLLKPYPIKWVPIPYHKKPPVLSSVYDVMMLKKMAGKLHAIEKFDMVHTRPGVPALIGLWMKKKMGVKFLNDIREFYADSRVEGGIWDTKNFLYKMIYTFFKRKEEEAVENNDGIVCLTYAAERIIEQWPQYKKTIPLEVIPCSVDMDLFDPCKIDKSLQSKFRKELGIDDADFIISYLGSVGGWCLIVDMMQFFKNLSDKIPAAKFLFISQHKPETIIDIAQKSGVHREKILVVDAQRPEIPVLLSLSDYSMFFVKPCYSRKSTSPTKHGEIMAMGIPVIANAGVGDVEEIVEKYNSGIILKQLNEQQFLLTAETISKGIPFNKTAIRNSARDFYDLRNAIDKYREMYASVLKEIS